MKPDQEAAIARFNRDFRIVPTSLFDPPSSLSMIDQPRGDCQDYAKTVKAILGVKFPQAVVWRCWSPINGRIPRHAVLWVKGKGYIDSTERKWRDTPAPHRKAWPVGTVPAVAALAFVAVQAWLRGWW
jgi:hypothetical protein